jgi:OFA family oxalate/formate antiporter-like MFS transporter
LFSYCFTSFGSYRYISYILLPFLVFLLIGSLTITKPKKVADKS